MIWASILGIILFSSVLFYFEWRGLQQKSVKEKAVLLLLFVGSAVLSILLIVFPDLPSPTLLMNQIYEPLHNWMQQQ